MRIYIGLFLVIILLSVFIAVQACGSKSSPSGSDSLSLSVDSDWQLPVGEPQGFKHVSTKLDDGNYEVSVIASGDDVRGALLKIRFDTSEYRLSESNPGSGFDGQEVLFLAVPTNDGVDAAIMLADLKSAQGFSGEAEVLRLIIAKGSDVTRSISVAPTGSPNQVTLSLAEWQENGDMNIRFSGRNIGDYDLSGEVGIPDVTQIALNYLAVVPGPLSPLAVVDGDNSMEIGIPDITPIAQNYLATLAGYNIQYSADGGTNWEFPTIQSNPNISVSYEDNTGFNPWPIFEFTMGAAYISGLPGFDTENDNLRLRAIPHDGTSFGVPGFSKKPTGGGGPPPVDETPPVWDNLSQRGVYDVIPVPDTRALDVMFGSATDADTPPVEYLLYYAEASQFNIDDLDGTTTLTVLSRSGAGPFTQRVTGLEWSTTYTFLMRARDSVVPPNVTTDSNTIDGTVVDEVIIPSDFTFTSLSFSPVSPVTLGTPVTMTANGNKTGPGTLTFEWSDSNPSYGFFYEQVDGASSTTAKFVGSEPGDYVITVKAYINTVLSDTIEQTLTVTDGARVVYDPDVMGALAGLGCVTCHSGGSPASGIDFSTAASYDSLVWVPSTTSPPLLRAHPGNPYCIMGNIGRGGEPVPGGHGGGGPINPLRMLLGSWINTGAYRSAGVPPPPQP